MTNDDAPKAPLLELVPRIPGNTPSVPREYIDPDKFAEFAGDDYDDITAKSNRQNAEGLFALGCVKLIHHVVISIAIKQNGVPMGAITASSRLTLPDDTILQHALAVIVQRLTVGEEASLDPYAKPTGEGN